jgi:hypothetical protein
MRPFSFLSSCLVVLGTVAIAGCSADAGSDGGEVADEAFSSNQATLLDFELDGSLVTDLSFNDKQTIQDQLLYTIGDLNQHDSVGRLDALVLTNIRKSSVGGRVRIDYHAKLPVAWGRKTNLPASYTFTLPRDVSAAGKQAFSDAHAVRCVDDGAHDVEPGNMWYYYRPGNAGCAFGPDEVLRVTANATRSALNTTGKYPELHKVWEDGRLEVVSIFGKNEVDGSAADAGVVAFNTFVRNMTRKLGQSGLVVTPSGAGTSPGPATKDVTLEANVGGGRTIKITALLVDKITEVWPGFDDRYEGLTPTADLIMYNGHAGLGQNVRALARKGRWTEGKYQVFFINGCDTFAYVDGALAQTRAQINRDDPTGSKYMEFVTNAMPSFFHSNAAADAAIIDGFLSVSQPKTYNQMFEGIDRAQIVLVTGEEDNVYTPGMPIGQEP